MHQLFNRLYNFKNGYHLVQVVVAVPHFNTIIVIIQQRHYHLHIVVLQKIICQLLAHIFTVVNMHFQVLPLQICL